MPCEQALPQKEDPLLPVFSVEASDNYLDYSSKLNIMKTCANTALIVSLGCLLLTPVASAEAKQSWSQLTKVAKPTHEGIQAKLKDSYLYLNFDGRSTCVPKESLLNLTAKMKERVSPQPRFQIVSWNEFMRANYSWIRNYPVTWEQVSGKAPLSESAIENLQKSDSLMIATYLKIPISFHLPEKEEESLSLVQ